MILVRWGREGGSRGFYFIREGAFVVFLLSFVCFLFIIVRRFMVIM